MPDSRTAQPIATPCVRLCAVEPASRLCLGCGRTLDEIGAWGSLSPAMREAIMATLPERLARLKAKRPAALSGQDRADESHARR